MATLQTATIGSTGTYLTHALAEADTDNNLVSLDQYWYLKQLAETLAGATYDGATTDSTRYRQVMANTGAEPTGINGSFTGIAILSSRIYAPEAYMRCYRITSLNSTNQGFTMWGVGHVVERCAVFGAASYGIDSEANGGRIQNNIVCGTLNAYQGIYSPNVTSLIYQNTVINGSGQGFNVGTGPAIWNNISAGNASTQFSFPGAPGDYNLSSDTSAPGANSQKSKALADTILVATVGSEDPHLKAGSAAIENGYDLTSAGVTDDFWAGPRTVPFDIGVHEYSSDIADPVCTITTPTSDPTYTWPALDALTIAGSASDDVAVTEVRWVCSETGGSGTATGTTSWTFSFTPQLGTNTVVVTAHDAAGKTGTDTIVVTVTLPTTVDKTIGTGGDYATVELWLAAQSACASTNTIQRGCFLDGTHSATGGAFAFAGTDVDQYRYMVLRQNIGARTSLKRGYGAVLNFVVNVTSAYAKIQDLQVSGNNINITDCNGVVVERCLVVGSSRAIQVVAGTAANGVIRNNAIYGSTTWGIRLANVGTGWRINNNAVLNPAGTAGISLAAANDCVELRNNIVLGGSVSGYSGLANATAHSNNESSDATGDTGYTGKTAANEVCSMTAGSENAFPKPGAFALEAGYDLSAQFTTDYFGTTRAAPWNIGPCETTDATGPVLTVTDPTDPHSTFDPDHTFVGTASDLLSGVDSVRWETDNGDSGNCTGTTSFTADIPFAWGDNVVTVIAADLYGNETEEEVTVTLARISKPVLVLTATATGFTAALSGYDVGTTNTLWVGQTDGAFVSKGSTWVADEIDVVAGSGRWCAFVISESSNQSNVSDVEMVKSLDLAWELKTGVTRATTGVR